MQHGHDVTPGPGWTMRSRWTRDALSGAVVGTVLAGGLHLWQEVANPLFGMAHEGVGFSTYMIAYLLGFPANLLTWFLRGESVSVQVEYVSLLLSIVLNGALIGAARGLWKQRKG